MRSNDAEASLGHNGVGHHAGLFDSLHSQWVCVYMCMCMFMLSIKQSSTTNGSFENENVILRRTFS